MSQQVSRFKFMVDSGPQSTNKCKSTRIFNLHSLLNPTIDIEIYLILAVMNIFDFLSYLPKLTKVSFNLS